MKKKITCILLLFFVSYMHVTAQLTFQKAIGKNFGSEEGNDIKVTPDSGYVIAGSGEYPGSGMGSDMHLVRTNKSGDTLWTRDFGGNYLGFALSNEEDAFSLELTADSGYILAGRTASFDTIHISGQPHYDIYLVCVDTSGNLKWTKHIDNINHGGFDESGYCIIKTYDANFLVLSATSFNYSGTGYYSMVCKITGSGDTLWVKNYTFEQGYSLVETADHGFASYGVKSYFSISKPGIYISKMDSSGNVIWKRMFGESGSSTGFYYGSSLAFTHDHSYALCGSDSAIHSIFLKVDTAGNLISARKYFNCTLYSLKETADGGFIMAGLTRAFGIDTPHYNGIMIRTDSMGNLIWSKAYGGYGTDKIYSVSPTSDNGFIFTGATSINNSYDLWLVKTDSLGNSGCFEYPANVTVVAPTIVDSTITAGTQTLNGAYMAPTNTIQSIIPNALVYTPCNFPVGVSPDEGENNFSVYPNPSNEIFKISFNDNTPKNIFLFNMLGQNVFEKRNVREKELEINLSRVSKGIYFMQIKTRKRSYMSKVVLE